MWGFFFAVSMSHCRWLLFPLEDLHRGRPSFPPRPARRWRWKYERHPSAQSRGWQHRPTGRLSPVSWVLLGVSLGRWRLLALCFSRSGLWSGPSLEVVALKSSKWFPHVAHGIRVLNFAATPCKSPQATSRCLSPAVPRTILQTLTGRAVMVVDVLTIWNGYSCQDPRWLTAEESFL